MKLMKVYYRYRFCNSKERRGLSAITRRKRGIKVGLAGFLNPEADKLAFSPDFLVESAKQRRY